jgi:hypothetical protein
VTYGVGGCGYAARSLRRGPAGGGAKGGPWPWLDELRTGPWAGRRARGFGFACGPNELRTDPEPRHEGPKAWSAGRKEYAMARRHKLHRRLGRLPRAPSHRGGGALPHRRRQRVWHSTTEDANGGPHRQPRQPRNAQGATQSQQPRGPTASMAPLSTPEGLNGAIEYAASRGRPPQPAGPPPHWSSCGDIVGAGPRCEPDPSASLNQCEPDPRRSPTPAQARRAPRRKGARPKGARPKGASAPPATRESLGHHQPQK